MKLKLLQHPDLPCRPIFGNYYLTRHLPASCPVKNPIIFNFFNLIASGPGGGSFKFLVVLMRVAFGSKKIVDKFHSGDCFRAGDVLSNC